MEEKSQTNLLFLLHRWAEHQDENFITDAFAHLLRFLAAETQVASVRIFRNLTNGFLDLPQDDLSAIDITTQSGIESGTLDIRLSSPDCLIFIEIKVESEFSAKQLEKYWECLEGAKAEKKRLILITRYPVWTELKGIPYVHHRWYEVANWIEDEFRRMIGQDRCEIAAYLTGQFLDFLRARRMTMEQVTWQLVEGIRALNSLMDMLLEAIKACQGKVKWAAGGTEFNGYTFLKGKREFWVGVSYKQPGTVRFEAYGVDKNLAEKIGYGEVKADKDKHQWRNRLMLPSEEVHFFALSKASQMRCLEDFIRESLGAAVKASS